MKRGSDPVEVVGWALAHVREGFEYAVAPAGEGGGVVDDVADGGFLDADDSHG